MNIKEAARRLGKSEITIRRLIKADKLKASLEGGKYSISEEAANKYALINQEIKQTDQDNQAIERLREEKAQLDQMINQLSSQLEYLKEQLSNRDERIERLEQLLAMEKQQNQRLVEYHLQPFWKRLFGRQKALPAPDDVVDMETDGGDTGDR